MDHSAKTLALVSSDCVMSALYGIMPCTQFSSLRKRVAFTFE